MKKAGGTEVGREIDVEKTTRFVNENLEKLVLLNLRAQGPLSGHEVIQEIFNRYGVSPSRAKVSTMLDSLKGRGLVAETNRGLLTVYTLTEKGRWIAGKVLFK